MSRRSSPSVRVTLHDFGEPLVGEHVLYAKVTLCDRSFDLPVRVTVSVDELVPGASERFEATIVSLAPDIELKGEVAFSHVCTFSTRV